MAKPRPAPVSWILLLVLLVAVALGAAASILVAPNTSSVTSSSPGTPTQEVFLPTWVFVAAILGMLIFVIVVWVLIRIDASGGRGVSNNIFFAILGAIAIICLAVVAFRVLGLAPSGVAPSSGGVGNNSTNTTPPPVTPCTVACNISGVGSVQVFPGVPSWLPFVIFAVVAAIAVAIAVPKTRQYFAERRVETPDRRKNVEESTVKVRDALARASNELDLGADPRTVILALYQETLLHLRPMVGSMESATPEEIRAVYLEHFGVRPQAARTLTRLFEEARYSTHPMGPADSARAQEAMRATIDDLSRRSFPK